MSGNTSGRVFNFSAGPAVLPVSVLQKIQAEMMCLPGVGSSILEISHRSKAFDKILDKTTADLYSVLNIPSNYKIAFLQGGSRLQFSMIPMNLLRGTGKTADYILTGSWGKYAADEAKKEGNVNVAWNGKATNYDRLPNQSELKLTKDAAYVHFTSNETIQGVQFLDEPSSGDAPLICDASSDFLCRPLDIAKYGMIYACAQKNAGPSGVTVVIVRDDLVAQGSDSLPGYLLLRNHVQENSRWNTPATFGIYVVGLILEWLKNEVGGLDKMLQLNKQKCEILYQVVDNSNGFYRGHAVPQNRSLMNVTFRLPSEALEEEFVNQAKPLGLTDLKGHRSVGGIRASIYNAMPIEGVKVLAKFMEDFAKAKS